MSVALRVAGNTLQLTAAVREAVAGVDTNLPIYDVGSMNDMFTRATWFYRAFGVIFSSFGITALFLAMMGLNDN